MLLERMSPDPSLSDLDDVGDTIPRMVSRGILLDDSEDLSAVVTTQMNYPLVWLRTLMACSPLDFFFTFSATRA